MTMYHHNPDEGHALVPRMCPTCGSEVKWRNGRYYPFCSAKCEERDRELAKGEER